MRILYVTTVSNTINAFLIPHIRSLIEQGHKVDVACNIVNRIDESILQMGCQIHNIPFQRSPFNLNNFKAYKQVKSLVKSNKYDIIHMHTPVASTIVRVALKNNKNIRMIYTAHGFHFYRGAPILNWILYYPIEKRLSRYTDTIITINEEDYRRAKKSLNAKKIVYLPGVGIDLKKIENIKVDKDKKREELGLPKDSFVMLSVGELNENKNHKVVIEALGKIKNPNIHYAICGVGPLEKKLKELCVNLEILSQVHFLGYRKDVIEICKVSDLFIFPSKREGLPVSVMEAMACGLPVICSDIRGNRDLIDNQKGGFLINIRNSNEIIRKIKTMSINKIKRMEFKKHNRNNIKKYSRDNIEILILKIYTCYKKEK